MSENKDVYSNVKGQMGLSERIAHFIPGFRGYKEKELRRESDRLIRKHLHLKLSKSKDDVRSISQKLVDKRYLDVMTDMDRLIAKMDRIVEKINHASYGYTGFFDAVKVKEEALDRMIDFDNNLIDEVNGLGAEISAFKGELATVESKDLKDKIQGIVANVENLEDTFDKREEKILGAM